MSSGHNFRFFLFQKPKAKKNLKPLPRDEASRQYLEVLSVRAAEMGFTRNLLTYFSDILLRMMPESDDYYNYYDLFANAVPTIDPSVNHFIKAEKNCSAAFFDQMR